MPQRFRLGIIAFAVGAAFALGAFVAPRSDDFFALRKNFQIFGALFEELASEYVDDVDATLLMRAGIDAMLERLDPYTTFMDEADQAHMDILSRGRYGGVGVTIGTRDDRLTIIETLEGSPAFVQGVRVGDVIEQIGGRSADEITPADARNLLRGEPGSVVEVVLSREGVDAPLEFALRRESVQIDDVSFAGLVDGEAARAIGYIKLDRFGQSAPREMRDALARLQDDASLNGLVIDLRGNPGGLLEAAVDIVGMFVPRGTPIVTTHGRTLADEITFRTQNDSVDEALPVAILIDEHSASASEIVAGAMQDLDRGVVVGRPSFGKGLVQVVRPLPYNTALKFTKMRYYTPSGRSIQRVDTLAEDASSLPTHLTRAGRTVRDGLGVEPDAPAGPIRRSELEEALERRAAFFLYAGVFAAQAPSLETPFVVTDEVYADFRRWLKRDGFTYRTSAEDAAGSLLTELDAAGYDDVRRRASEITAAIESAKDADFDRFENRLRERLRQEIAARFMSESDRIRASFPHDESLKAAVDLLRNESAYRGLLAGTH